MGLAGFFSLGCGRGAQKRSPRSRETDPALNGQSDRDQVAPFFGLWACMYPHMHALTYMGILVHGNSFSDFDFRVDSQKYNKPLRRLGQTSHGLRATTAQFTSAFT